MEKVNQASVNSIMSAQPAGPPDGTGELPHLQNDNTRANFYAGVIKLDPWLSPFKDSLKQRFSKAQDWISAINESEGSLEQFSRVRAPPPSSYRT
jgi:1,4-alpha-glucan branching enzyme